MKKLNAGIQEALVALLLYDDAPQGAKAVAALVEPKTFDPYWRDLAAEAVSYLTQFGKPAKEHTHDIVESLKARNPDQEETWTRIFKSLQTTRHEINREYVLSKVGFFARRQRAKAAMQKALPLLQKDDDAAVQEAEVLLSGLAKNSIEASSPGLLLNDPSQALSFLDVIEEEAMPMGIKELDKYNLGPVRKGLWVGVAPPNRGKTWMAIQKGKMGLVHGKRVCHISLEMSEQKIAMRYVQSLFAVQRREAEDLIVRRFKTGDKGQFMGLEEFDIKDRPSLTDPDIHKYLLRRMRPLMTRPRLVVKQFPTGQLTIPRLNAYLDHLEASMQFIPDMVIIDYADLMDIDAKNYRHALDAVYKGIRGVGVERNMAMVTYSQSSKLGLSTKVINIEKAAEDFRKMATADTVITYNQTDAEHSLGLARLFVAKARDEARNFQVLITQAYGMGQFVVDSLKMDSKPYWALIGEHEKTLDDEKADDGE